MTLQSVNMPTLLNRGILSRSQTLSEHQLINHVVNYCAVTGKALPQLLVIDYWVAVKSHPFVLLFGPRGQGKTEIVQLFAEALIKPFDEQYDYVNFDVQFDQAFIEFQERFSWVKFIETLENAADPANMGKVYFLCLDSLRFHDVVSYFSNIIRDQAGNLRLAIRGYPMTNWPILPPNVVISGTLDTDDILEPAQRQTLAQINCVYVHNQWLPQAQPPSLSMPTIAPIGYQSAIVAHGFRSTEAVHQRLIALLGEQLDDIFAPPDELMAILWQAHLTYDDTWRNAMLRTVANSFTIEGHGLFSHHQIYENARFAYSFAMARQMLLRLWGNPHYEQRLTAYLQQLLKSLSPSSLGGFTFSI